MAAKKTELATKLSISVVTGQKPDGTMTTAARTVGNINPSLTDTDMLDIGTDLGALQKYEVAAVKRIDSAELVNE